MITFQRLFLIEQHIDQKDASNNRKHLADEICRDRRYRPPFLRFLRRMSRQTTHRRLFISASFLRVRLLHITSGVLTRKLFISGNVVYFPMK